VDGAADEKTSSGDSGHTGARDADAVAGGAVLRVREHRGGIHSQEEAMLMIAFWFGLGAVIELAFATRAKMGLRQG